MVDTEGSFITISPTPFPYTPSTSPQPSRVGDSFLSSLENCSWIRLLRELSLSGMGRDCEQSPWDQRGTVWSEEPGEGMAPVPCVLSLRKGSGRWLSTCQINIYIAKACLPKAGQILLASDLLIVGKGSLRSLIKPLFLRLVDHGY